MGKNFPHDGGRQPISHKGYTELFAPTEDSGKVSSNTLYPVVPAKDFMPGYDLEGDPQYREISGGLTPLQKEFAKALCQTHGTRIAALRIVQPTRFSDSTDHHEESRNARQASALAKHAGVMRLFKYLQPMCGVSSKNAVSLEELVTKYEEEWRTSKDPKMVLALGQEIYRLRQLHTQTLVAGSAIAKEDILEESRALLDGLDGELN